MCWLASRKYARVPQCCQAVSLMYWILRSVPPKLSRMTRQTKTKTRSQNFRAGMVGMGMIFDETYRPFFERVHAEGLFDRKFGVVDVPLSAVATRTGARAAKYRAASTGRVAPFSNFTGERALDELLESGVDFV